MGHNGTDYKYMKGENNPMFKIKYNRGVKRLN